jgi:hypothetical protein
MSRLPLRLIVACCSLNAAVGCVHQTDNSIVRYWADWNTLGQCAAYYERVNHKPYYPARVGYFKAMYNANPGHGGQKRFQLVEHAATGDIVAAPNPCPSGETIPHAGERGPHADGEVPPPLTLAPPKIEVPAPQVIDSPAPSVDETPPLPDNNASAPRVNVIPPPPPTRTARSQSDHDSQAPSDNGSPGLSPPGDDMSMPAEDNGPTSPDIVEFPPPMPAPPVSTSPIDSEAPLPPESSTATMDFLRDKARSGRAFLRSFFGP